MLIDLKCDRRSGNHTAVYVFLDGYRSMVRVARRRSKIPISLADAKQRYVPCGRCNPLR